MDDQTFLGDYGKNFWHKPAKRDSDIQTVLPIKKIRKTYPQNWKIYDYVKSNEKIFFMKVLKALIDSLKLPYDYKGNGRLPITIEDRLKSCILKVYQKSDARKLVSDLILFKSLGFLNYAPSFRSINYFMEDSRLTLYLNQLIKLTAEPLAPIESCVAIDSTGFSTFNRVDWIDIRFSKYYNKLRKDYKKLHIVTGTKSNIILSAKITKGTVHDSPEFEDLIKQSVYFDIKQVAGDPAYLSRKNCEIVASIKAVPFILPKKNSTTRAKGSPAWSHMVKFFRDNETEFRKHYHTRSNVESSFAMLKRNYLPYVRAKSDIGQENEGLCKVICHNIAVLIMSVFEYNLNTKYLETN